MREFQRRSIILRKGIYQWEWLEDHIAVSKWDVPPISSDQWVSICPNDGDIMTAKFDKFYLEGTNNRDICITPYEGPLQIGEKIQEY